MKVGGHFFWSTIMPNTTKIRELNDVFRTTLQGGQIVLSQGISCRDDIQEILTKVQRFNTFGEHNDPHRERDFGAFESGPDTIFWKIDYYNRELSAGSEDPSDSAMTTRVMTIMRADEY
jgi:hypothetical protein